MSTPFQILGLPEHASFEDVRRKYLELAKKYHPDNGGNAEDFSKISKAYDTIEIKQKKMKKVANHLKIIELIFQKKIILLKMLR